ncbi:MAG TPA: 5-formyltetrahydrofolate cyclo-ligase [Lachnospiraceae bacterium]|nr:5-formyltetrahydrofolate cyclo-ligase [Lachnospiraceae bacterium]
MNDKAKLRKRMLSIRDELTGDIRAENSELIRKKLVGSSIYKNAEIVLSYASYRSEVDTWAINKQILADNKKLYLPKTYVKEKRLRFIRVSDMDELKPGALGIMEPDGEGEGIDPKMTGAGAILMIMPGVAFDNNGARLGYGGGFYDRYLSEYEDIIPRTVLIAFEAQRADEICTDEYDIRPGQILTEAGFRKN